MDILVTTPQGQSAEASRESAEARAQGGYYFRFLGRHQPKEFGLGDRVWYTEGGYVRGFGVCCQLRWTPEGETCDTTGREFKPGWYAWIDVRTWQWVVPFPYRGFQGWRYCDFGEPQIAGGYLDEKPEVTK